MDTKPTLYKATEIAERYKVSARQVYRWANTGLIGSVKIGRTVRFYDPEENPVKA